MVRTQQAVAQAVEGTNPHATHVVRQHGRQARCHFLGSLVGEGHGHDAAGRDLPGLQQPSNARGQHPRLARTSARQHQRMALRQGHSRALFVIQALQQGRVLGGRCASIGTIEQVNWKHGGIVESHLHASGLQVHHAAGGIRPSIYPSFHIYTCTPWAGRIESITGPKFLWSGFFWPKSAKPETGNKPSAFLLKKNGGG